MAALFFLAAAAAGCGEAADRRAEAPAEPSEPLNGRVVLAWSGIGLATPESVLYDAAGDVYLVSNINGGAADRDDNGFISRLSPAGDVLALKWVDGARPGVTLHAPKGMAIVADTLFVTDIDCVRRFHRETGRPLGEVCLEGAGFLNDIAATEEGDLFFSDSGTSEVPGGVYLLRHTADVPQVVTLADGTPLQGDSLRGANGLCHDEEGLWVANYRTGEVFRISRAGARVGILTPEEKGFDGLVCLGEGTFLVSSWADAAVYLARRDGRTALLIGEVETPADIGYDGRRGRLLVPLFRADEVRAVEWE